MAKPKQTYTTHGSRQQLFLKYTLLVLVDLMVLGLLNQYWDLLFIETFTIAMMTALLLQFLLQIAIRVEHMAADYFFGGKTGRHIKVMRGVSAWAIIFISKLVILKVLSLAFGDSVIFSGPIHGVVSFIATVIVIIMAEQGVIWIYRSLADPGMENLSQTELMIKLLNERGNEGQDTKDLSQTERSAEENKK